MEQSNRKYIAIISFLRRFIGAFFTIFFNVYILKIVNNDFNFVLKYSLFAIILDFIFTTVFLIFINSKVASWLYRFSFIFQVVNILILILFKESIVNYIYLFKLLERFANISYALPYELVLMGSNSNKTMTSFVANVNILSYIATIITPFVSGFIIDKFSYTILFIILIIEAILIMIVSFKIKDFTVSSKRLDVKKYFKIVKQKQHLKDIYNCMFFRRISSQGALLALLPIILYLRLGTELELGTYNSLFAVLSIVSLQLLKILNKKHPKFDIFITSAVLIFISSAILVFVSNFTTLLIYYILMNSLGTIIESESCSVVYASIKFEDLVEYKKEHVLFYNIYMVIGQIVSYILVFALYNYFYNVNILSIAISVLMAFLIISAIYLRKTKNYLINNSN